MHKGKLFVISGASGVGKSTISTLLAKNLKKSVLLEGDYIYGLVVGGYVSAWKDGNHLNLFWSNCTSIIENCLEQGYDVVFNYILHNYQIEDLKRMFPDVQIKFVCLFAKEEELIFRDKQRSPENQMGERVLTLLDSLKKQNFNKKNILDTTNISAEIVVDKILNSDEYII